MLEVAATTIRREGRVRRHAARSTGRPDSPAGHEDHRAADRRQRHQQGAGEYYHLVYNNVFGVRDCSLRLTNVYGPRQLLKHNRQGFIAWFIRLAIAKRRDSDLRRRLAAARFRLRGRRGGAFLRAGASDASNGHVFNVGGSEPITHRDLTTLLIEIAGTGRVEYVEWPPEKKKIDIGDFYADSSKFTAATGWRPTVALRDGLARTIAFYREHWAHYVEAPAEPA